MTVRELQPSDLQSLLALYRHLNPMDPPLDDGTARDIWLETLANPRSRHFGGFDGDVLVSACTITVIPNLTRGGRPYALIENVVTDATHRRRGWGNAVLAAALEFAWSHGCYKVMLLTGRKNEATHRFYEKARFSKDEKQGFVARPVA